MQCAKCKAQKCYLEGKDCTGMKDEIAALYRDPEKRKIMEAAEGLEAEGTRLLTRVEELARFSQRMNYTHLGIAFCAGCAREASQLNTLLEPRFTITSACCTMCGMEKKDVFPESTDDTRQKKVLCNPLGQAEILNRAETELNIVIGLCVGHDILFAQSSNAPVTTLVVKDRVLVNNPSAVFSSYYWKKILSDRLQA